MIYKYDITSKVHEERKNKENFSDTNIIGKLILRIIKKVLKSDQIEFKEKSSYENKQ